MFSGEALPKEEVCLGIKQRGSRCALLWEISPGRESLASFVEYRVAAVGRSRAWSLKIERGSNKKGRAEGWPGFVGEARRGGGETASGPDASLGVLERGPPEDAALAARNFGA